MWKIRFELIFMWDYIFKFYKCVCYLYNISVYCWAFLQKIWWLPMDLYGERFTPKENSPFIPTGDRCGILPHIPSKKRGAESRSFQHSFSLIPRRFWIWQVNFSPYLICTKQVESLLIPIENKICFSWHLSKKLPIFFMCSWI